MEYENGQPGSTKRKKQKRACQEEDYDRRQVGKKSAIIYQCQVAGEPGGPGQPSKASYRLSRLGHFPLPLSHHFFDRVMTHEILKHEYKEGWRAVHRVAVDPLSQYRTVRVTSSFR